MTIMKMPFGRLAHLSTRTLFGAAALSHVSQDEADRALDVLLHYDINHIDAAASYGDAELHCRPGSDDTPNISSSPPRLRNARLKGVKRNYTARSIAWALTMLTFGSFITWSIRSIGIQP